MHSQTSIQSFQLPQGRWYAEKKKNQIGDLVWLISSPHRPLTRFQGVSFDPFFKTFLSIATARFPLVRCGVAAPRSKHQTASRIFISIQLP